MTIISPKYTHNHQSNELVKVRYIGLDKDKNFNIEKYRYKNFV